jgi:hypothetical protein
MNSQNKELKIDTWIKQKLFDGSEILIATETHLTHKPYIQNLNFI